MLRLKKKLINSHKADYTNIIAQEVLAATEEIPDSMKKNINGMHNYLDRLRKELRDLDNYPTKELASVEDAISKLKSAIVKMGIEIPKEEASEETEEE